MEGTTIEYQNTNNLTPNSDATRFSSKLKVTLELWVLGRGTPLSTPSVGKVLYLPPLEFIYWYVLLSNICLFLAKLRKLPNTKISGINKRNISQTDTLVIYLPSSKL